MYPQQERVFADALNGLDQEARKVQTATFRLTAALLFCPEGESALCRVKKKSGKSTYVEELFDLGVGFECGQGLHGKILIAAVDHVQLQVVHLESKWQPISDSMRGLRASASKDVPQSRRLCQLKLFSGLAERCPC